MPQIPQGGVDVNPAMTQDQILGTIRAARDSVWVINEEMGRDFYRPESKNLLSANVSHLKLVVGNPEIADSGEDISDLHAAITLGEQGLAELEAAE